LSVMPLEDDEFDIIVEYATSKKRRAK